MNFPNLSDVGLYVPFEKMNPCTVDIVKSLLLDALLSMIGGYHSVPEKEMQEFEKMLSNEPEVCRTIWPSNKKISREMAGFLNGYFIRYADWCDVQRQNVGRGGHPGDMCAALLAIADEPGIEGKKLIEALNSGYQVWAVVLNQMLSHVRGQDQSTGLSFTVPIMAAISHGDDDKHIINALGLSLINGLFLSGRSAPLTNMKNGATGYQIARILMSYRWNNIIEAPPSVFGEKAESWDKYIASFDGEIKSRGDEEVYSHIQLKSIPSCNVNQSPLECALVLHEKVKDRLEHISKIKIGVCEADAPIAIKTDQPKYPYDHPSADHHLRYCADAALRFGNAGPTDLYCDEWMQDEMVRHLIDITDTFAFDEDTKQKLGGENGCCTFEIIMDDGEIFEMNSGRPSGLFTGYKLEELPEKFRGTLEIKRAIVENSYGYDLSRVVDVIYNLEKYSGVELLDAICEAVN